MTESSKSKSVFKKMKLFFKREKLKIELYDERLLKIFKILGLLIFVGCIIYWIYFMFLTDEYGAVLYTTYFTIILISFTCILKLKSVFLNTVTCLTFYGFINITIGMITQVKDFPSLVVGPVLHGTITVFQLFLVFHPKIPISKKYLYWGVLFYIIFTASYDNFQRWNYIIGLTEFLTNEFTKAYAFYALLFSTIGVYFYKKRFGIVVD